MNNKRNNRYKSRGSILVITALAAIVWIFIAQSLFIVGAGGFGMIKSSRVALQAQQYAEIEVDRLKNVAYENLDSDGAHSRQAIANIQESGWEDEVSIGSEHSISGSDDAKQRIATINVYKSGDTLPRFTLEVPLSSQSSIPPVGTILAYVGDLNKVPTNWHLCDGTNGTPDLRGRFLEGVTSGIRQFHSAGIPNISGVFGNTEEGGAIINGAFYVYSSTSNIGAAGADQVRALALNEILHYRLEGDKESGYRLVESHIPWENDGGMNIGFNASRSNSIYGRSSTVQPNSYTVYYIMKIR